jgi:hypothetical protein
MTAKIPDIVVSPDSSEKGFREGTFSAIFSASAQILNSERQTIWARYSAFMVAASIFFRLDKTPAAVPFRVLYALGTLLGVAWLVTHWRGYTHFQKYRRRAERFVWTGDGRFTFLNPIQNDQSRVDLIKWLSLAVIVGFITVFVGLAYYGIDTSVALQADFVSS